MCMKERLWKQRAVGVRLTAAVLIRAVGAVRLFITLITCRDAGAIAQAFKLLRGTPVARTLGGCRHVPQLLITRLEVENFSPIYNVECACSFLVNTKL